MNNPMWGQDKILGLFFTKGVSLQLWYENGLLDREKLIYEQYLKKNIFNQIYWFTYGRNDDKWAKYVSSGIKIIPMPKMFRGIIGNIAYSFLMPIIKRKEVKKCSVYKTNQMCGAWAAVISKLLYKKPLLVRTGYTWSLNTKRNDNKLWYLIYKMIERFIYYFADCSSVSSALQRNYVVVNFKIKNMIVNYNYIDIDLFTPIVTKKSKDIIYVGRLSEEKNLKNLIKAAAKLNYKLDIYGDGDLKNEIINLINNLKKQNYIFLKGIIPNDGLSIILNEYKLFVLPSKYECMPKALLEAMACNMCCLGTNVPGINEIIKHGYNGWLTGIDENSIETAIKYLMMNSNQRKKLGQNARKFIETNFSLNKAVSREIQIYQKFFNRK